MPPSQPKRDSLEEYLKVAVDKISDGVERLTCSFNDFKLEYTKSHTQLVSTVDENTRRIDGHDKDIQSLRDEIEKLSQSIAPLIVANKIMVFIAGAAGLSIIAMIWGIITHQFHFP